MRVITVGELMDDNSLHYTATVVPRWAYETLIGIDTV